MLFNLFSKTPTQEELYKKQTQQELKGEAAERMVKNFEARISLMYHSIYEAIEERDEAIKKGLVEKAAEKEVSIKLFRERLEKIRKEFQKEILELTA